MQGRSCLAESLLSVVSAGNVGDMLSSVKMACYDCGGSARMQAISCINDCSKPPAFVLTLSPFLGKTGENSAGLAVIQVIGDK